MLWSNCVWHVGSCTPRARIPGDAPRVRRAVLYSLTCAVARVQLRVRAITVRTPPRVSRQRVSLVLARGEAAVCGESCRGTNSRTTNVKLLTTASTRSTYCTRATDYTPLLSTLYRTGGRKGRVGGIVARTRTPARYNCGRESALLSRASGGAYQPGPCSLAALRVYT